MSHFNWLNSRRKQSAPASSRLSRAIFETLENRRLLSGTVATWTGAGNSNLWSNPANWQSNTLPAAGQDVDFPTPAGNAQRFVTVDVSPTIGSLELDNTVLQGSNTITLQGNVTTDATHQSAILNPITVDQDTMMSAPYNLVLGGIIGDGGNGHAITFNGGGEIDLGVYTVSVGVVAVSGSGNIAETYTGTTTLDNVELNLNGTLASTIDAQNNSYVIGNHTAGGFAGADSALFAGDNSTGLPATLTLSQGLSLDSNSALYTQIASGSSYSQVVVSAGTIDLGDATLSGVSFNGTTPDDGDVLAIIQNNTGNGIVHTFAGMAEGSTQLIVGHYYTISYLGGASGHDVTLTATSGPTDIWTNGAGTGHWSNVGNWSLGAIPVAGENVEFNTSGDTVNVDSPSIDIGSLTLDHTTLSGNAIRIEGGITNTDDSVIHDAITLAHNTTIDAGNGSIGFQLPISEGGNSCGITVLGGTVRLGVAGGAAMTFTGTTEIQSGATANIDVSVASPITIDSGATANLSAVTGAGITSSGGTINLSDGSLHSSDVIENGNLTLDGATTVNVRLDGTATNTTFAYSQIAVNNGQVSLNNATLDLAFGDSSHTFSPALGDRYTIIANSTGNDVSGTFGGLAQDAHFQVNGYQFQIDYHGGTSGRDVVLTVIKSSSFIYGGSPTPTAAEGNNVVLGASVTGSDNYGHTAGGNVSFYDGSTFIGTGTLVNGEASIDTTSLSPGTHTINAVYAGDTNFFGSNLAGEGDTFVETITPAIPPVVSIVSVTSPVRTSTRFATLSARGTDTAAAGEAGLTYTWSVLTSPSGAKTPLMPGNGTNAAKNMTMRMYKDGGYLFRVTATDAFGYSAVRNVQLIVDQTAKSIRLTPHARRIAASSSLQLNGSVLDQFNHPVREPYALVWSVAAGSGSISDAGLFSSTPIPGHVSIEAEFENLTGTIRATVI